VWLAVLLTFALLHCDPIDFLSMAELIQITRGFFLSLSLSLSLSTLSPSLSLSSDFYERSFVRSVYSPS
jgi:hypothetical protein